MRRTSSSARLLLGLVTAAGFRATLAFGQSEPTQPPPERIEILPRPPEPRLSSDTYSDQPPPPRPRRRGLMLESTLGMLAFAGQFRHVAPPAYLMRAALGYELWPWLTLLAESELGFTDTTESQDPSHARAFPIWGIGGGVRVSAHLTPRFAAFVEGDVGALAAAVPHNALGNLGFVAAESPGVDAGGRLGVEWYQIDPHLALIAQGGARAALGFQSKLGILGQVGGSGDLPLMWDIGAGLRYAF